MSVVQYRVQVLLSVLVTWLFIGAGAAFASELAGVTMPASVGVGAKSLVLNGLGLREATFLKVDVFVGALYLEQKTHDPDEIIQSPQTKQVVMHFVRNVDAKDLRKAWTEGFEKNVGENISTLFDRIDQLNGWMSSMRVSNRMTFTFEGNNVEVEVKGSKRGTISGADFARAMLLIWFGPKPPNEGLKRGMLGHDQ